MRDRDLRLPALGLAAWAGGVSALVLPGLVSWLLVVLLVLFALALAGDLRRAVLVWLLVAVVVGLAATFREEAVRSGPVAALANRGAAVRVTLTVSSDPVPLQLQYGEHVRLSGTITVVGAQGQQTRVRAPVLVFGGPEWADVALGSVVSASGRLSRADGHDLSAILSVRGAPELLRNPGLLWRGASSVRREIRDAVRGRPPPERALVPALVVGDDSRIDEQMQADFRTSGLTHLLAVSGTNLTLVVGFLVVVGRWCGVRGRWQIALGAAGIVGFVLLARTEPSVVRAAAMGAAGLIGLGSNGRDRGPRALGLAVVLLLLWDPWLSTSVGFTLSVLATAGIIFLGPVWRDALANWMPLWLATAIAVPTAAQLACTPVVAAISGQVSLVAVVANLLAGPLVGPATVCGLLGGLVGLLNDGAGQALGWVAGWCAAGIIAVAQRCAHLTLPAVPWATGWVSIGLLVVLCIGCAVVAAPVLARRWSGGSCAAVLVVVVTLPLPSPGWPPEGWIFTVCDVGQGDALVLRAGEGAAVVVDAGPEPSLVDRCLDRLDISRVPLVVLTHFHADHVDGLPGVYDGRTVGEVDVTSMEQPEERVAAVRRATAGRARVPAYGESRRIGDVTFQVLGPIPGVEHHGDAADDGSGPNNASVVLLAEVRGVRILLTGDVEPEAQQALARSLPGLDVDVLKIPHHGSRYQDLDFLTGLHSRVAIASVSADNDYGHPAASTMKALSVAGARVLRTDLDGDVVVTMRHGALGVMTRD